MKKQSKQWFLLAFFAPLIALAQAPQEQVGTTTSPEAVSAAAPIEPEKRAAIKDLLDAIEADKLAASIAKGAQNQAKQLVPGILSEALTENKTLNDAQKRALIVPLQQNALPKLVEQAGEVFTTPAFQKDAVQLQYDAYAKYYTTSEIKDLTKFYKSPTGRKFIQVQDQVGRYVVSSLMGKYMTQTVQDIRASADKAVIATKPEPETQKRSDKADQKK